MALHIRQILPAEGWFAVFARPGSVAHEQPFAGARPVAPRPAQRAGGGVPDFLPLVAWALVDDSSVEELVGVVVHDNQHPELVLTDDPSFLGYAGPGDAGIDRTGLTPDWRTLARQALAELKTFGA